MFAKPQKVTRAQPEPKATSKSASRPNDTIEGWETYCAIDACMKALEGKLKLHRQVVEPQVGAILRERGIGARGKPDGLSLVDGKDARGNGYIRRRDTRNPLSLEEIEQIALVVGQDEKDPETGEINGVPGFTETVEVEPAVLGVNPDHLHNEALLSKVDKILAPFIAKGEIPEDFIIEFAARKKTIISEQAIGSMFHLGDAEKIDQLYPLVVAGVSLKPVFKDIDAAWEIVKPLMADDEPPAALKRAAHASLTDALKKSLAAEEAADAPRPARRKAAA